MPNRIKSGFTLIELLVSISILSILALSIIYIVNPVGQIAKAEDVMRLNDLNQLKTALNTYYNDHNAFPQSIVFGSEFSDNKTVYTAVAPQDPDSQTPYVYQADSTNPQWAIIYAKLVAPYPSYINCELKSLKNCLPKNYNDSGYNYCVVLGIPSCTYISQSAPAFPSTNNKYCKNLGGECIINNSNKSCCPGFVCVPNNPKSGNGICQKSPTPTPSK